MNSQLPAPRSRYRNLSKRVQSMKKTVLMVLPLVLALMGAYFFLDKKDEAPQTLELEFAPEVAEIPAPEEFIDNGATAAAPAKPEPKEDSALKLKAQALLIASMPFAPK